MSSQTPTIPPNPDSVSNAQLFLMMQSMHTKLVSVESKLCKLENEQRDMVETWRAGKAVLRIIKVAGSIGAAVMAITGVMALIGRGGA